MERFFFEVGSGKDYGLVLDDGSKFFIVGKPDNVWAFIFFPVRAHVATVLFTAFSLTELQEKLHEANMKERLEKLGYKYLGWFEGVTSDKAREMLNEIAQGA